ncbi:unnamed protein product [Urochloa humidicola]
MAASARSAVSTSGTYSSSTTYKSSRGSVVSSERDLGSQISRMDLSSGLEDDEEKVTVLERTKRMVRELCHGDGDTGALVERWLSEMGVGWVLNLSDDASAGTSLLLRPQRNLIEDWIRALYKITGSTFVFRLIQDVLVEKDVLDPVHLVLKETVLKMFPFVDALLAVGGLDADTDTADTTNGVQVPSVEKLRTLLDVRDAVFSATEATKLCFGSLDSSVEMEAQRSSGEVLSLLSAKEQRLDEALWNTMEEVRTSILDDDDDTRWGIQTLQGSSDTCKVTRSLIAYIKCLWGNYWIVDHIVRTAAKLGNFVVEQDQTNPLDALIMDMVSSLQEKLDKRSETFPDHSLRSIFLINNTYFIEQQLHLTTKIEDYIQKYLQVSWEPMLSCLQNHAPNYCFKTNSALPKFELEFQKTYTAQKLWKVPDPELRTRLRKAIVEKVVSGLTRYLEDNNVTNPGITPHEREEMLLELFEG